MRGLKKLESVFPVWKIESAGAKGAGFECLLDKTGCVTVGFTLHLPEIFTLSSADYATLHNSWVRALKCCMPGTILHKQDWFMAANYRSDFSVEQSFLMHASERHFNERPWLNHESYLFLTLVPSGRFTTDAFSCSLIRSGMMPAQSMDHKLLSEFMDRVGQFVKVLGDSGMIKIDRVTGEQLSSNEKVAGLLERYCYLQAKDDPRIISDIALGDELAIGDKHVSVYSLSGMNELPAACGPRINYDKYSTDVTKFSVGFASPFGLLLDCNHIVNQYLFIEEPQAVLKKQEKRRLKFQSLSAYSRENTISRDAVNSFLNEAIGLGRMPVKAHYNLVCFSDDRHQMREIRNKVSAAFAQIDAGTKQETESAAQLYWAGIPGNAAGLPVHECFDTFAEQACSFLVNETNYESSVSAFGIRLGDRLSGRPLHVDISDEPVARGITTNRNKFIIGPSGSGKSVFCNHLFRSYIEQGAHGVIVDVGHSYEGLCELMGGYYFTYSENNPISFNPFYVEGALDTEKKESIKTLLLALWKKDNEGFSRSEYVSLSNAVQGYYESNTGFPCFNGFYEFLSTRFADALQKEGIREKEFDLTSLLYVLKPYAKGGEFDFLLNAKANLDLLHQPMVVFELDNIKDHQVLFPAVTLIIMDSFLSKMRKLKGLRKVMLIEEAWKAIARQGMAEYIKYLFKTVRKFFGEAIVVTQDIDDIIGSPIVKDAIINNSDCKILLDQSKYLNKFGHIQELLGLSEKEKTLVLSLNKANDPGKKYKEVFFSLGGTDAKVYRVELSLEEYFAYTTEEKEKMQVKAYAQKYGSFQAGIRHLAREIREQNQAA